MKAPRKENTRIMVIKMKYKIVYVSCKGTQKSVSETDLIGSGPTQNTIHNDTNELMLIYFPELDSQCDYPVVDFR